MRIKRAHIQAITKNGKAAVDGTAADLGRKIFRQPAAIAPDGTPGAPIDCPGLIVVAGYVQNAVDDERRIFEAPSRQARYIGLEHPLRDESADILRRQLLQRTVPLPGIVAGERQPAR